jgi:predicted nucleic acid-binding protein
VARPERISSALLDASSLLGLITDDPDFRCLRSMLEAVDRGEIVLVESSAILAEVLRHHGRDTEAHARARETMRDLLEAPETRLVDVSTVVARKAAELRVDLGLRTWDAVHLATAIIAKVDVLVVRDGRFPMGDYEGVWVTGPFDLNDGNLLGLIGQAEDQPSPS